MQHSKSDPPETPPGQVSKILSDMLTERAVAMTPIEVMTADAAIRDFLEANGPQQITTGDGRTRYLRFLGMLPGWRAITEAELPPPEPEQQPEHIEQTEHPTEEPEAEKHSWPHRKKGH